MLHFVVDDNRSSFSEFAGKFGRDDRFKAIDKMRERESLFNEYMLEVRRREKGGSNNNHMERVRIMNISYFALLPKFVMFVNNLQFLYDVFIIF